MALNAIYLFRARRPPIQRLRQLVRNMATEVSWQRQPLLRFRASLTPSILLERLLTFGLDLMTRLSRRPMSSRTGQSLQRRGGLMRLETSLGRLTSPPGRTISQKTTRLTEGSYIFSDGTSLTLTGGTIGTSDATWNTGFTAWKDGQPKDDVDKQEKQDCVKVVSSTWDDVDCNNTMPAYACQRPPA